MVLEKAGFNSSPEVQDQVNQALEIIKKHCGASHYQVLLFGSWAKGSALNVSDIDLAILSETPIEGSIISDIREGTENLKTLRKFDIVDFSKAGELLQKAIRQEGIIIYEC